MAKDNPELNDILIIAVVGGIAYFGIVKPILNSLDVGNTQGQQDYDAQMALPNNQNPFSANYSVTGTATMTNDQYAALADQLYGDLGYLWIGEPDILNIFSQMKSKTDVSELAYQLRQQNSVDLLPFLKKGRSFTPFDNGISKDALSTIIHEVNALPSQ